MTTDIAISRQAAIDAIYARYIGGKEAVDKAPANDQYAEGIDEAVCAVEDLPPVTPQSKTDWIPVSEKLPEIHQDVLLSLRSLDVEVGFRGSAEPYYYCYSGYVEPQNVLAWQPLPEPYKEGNHGRI